MVSRIMVLLILGVFVFSSVCNAVPAMQTQIVDNMQLPTILKTIEGARAWTALTAARTKGTEDKGAVEEIMRLFKSNLDQTQATEADKTKIIAAMEAALNSATVQGEQITLILIELVTVAPLLSEAFIVII